MSKHEGTELPFLDHLAELRWRIIWSLAALIVGVGVAFFLLLRFDIIRTLGEADPAVSARPEAGLHASRRSVLDHPERVDRARRRARDTGDPVPDLGVRRAPARVAVAHGLRDGRA